MNEKKEPGENLTRVVGAVIVNNEGNKILLGQRAATVSHPLKWEFFGGKVEPGESPEEALRREVLEETSLKISVGKLLAIAEVDYRSLGKPSHQILFFEARILNGVAKLNSEIYHDVRWVDVKELANLDWIEADREFARKLAVSLTSLVPSRN